MCNICGEAHFRSIESPVGGTVFEAYLLLRPVYYREVVMAALHRPVGVSFITECFAVVGAYARVNEYRCGVDEKDKRAYVVMVVALSVVTTFCGEKESGAVTEIAYFGLAVPCVWLIDVRFTRRGMGKREERL